MISSSIRLFAIVGALVGLGLIISQYDPTHSELIENGHVLSATASSQLQAEASQSQSTTPTIPKTPGELFFHGIDTIQANLNPF